MSRGGESDSAKRGINITQDRQKDSRTSLQERVACLGSLRISHHVKQKHNVVIAFTWKLSISKRRVCDCQVDKGKTVVALYHGN